jgi:hypothetical protein
LKWTHQRGLSRQLVAPSIPRQQPAKLLDDDERWRLLQRCLTDTALPVDVRAAGALTPVVRTPDRTDSASHRRPTQLPRQTHLPGRRATTCPQPPMPSPLRPPSATRQLPCRADRCSQRSCLPHLLQSQTRTRQEPPPSRHRAGPPTLNVLWAMLRDHTPYRPKAIPMAA